MDQLWHFDIHSSEECSIFNLTKFNLKLVFVLSPKVRYFLMAINVSDYTTLKLEEALATIWNFPFSR